MAEVVQFTADTSDQDAVISVLEDALAKAKAGEIFDVAVAAVVRDEAGPQIWFSYYGEAQFAQLVAAVEKMKFDFHWRPAIERAGLSAE